MLNFSKFFKKVTAKNINSDLLFLSEHLSHKGNQEILFVEYFDEIVLDYSLESLKSFEKYLSKIKIYFQSKIDTKMNDSEKNEFITQFVSIILRIGAYVGETLRENDKIVDWYWIMSKEKCISNPILINSENAKIQKAPVLTNGFKIIFPMDAVSDLILKPNYQLSLYDYANTLLLTNSQNRLD
ncbi:hypothetical protein [Acinetobacter sp. P8-3-8]|uniref:hypothetical protein n=1 Tax=Acinetobacter sp. P8-3-8 TaxID=1029823 RepID=UPI0002486580|nr:hypothetical protein [Acinetobacter sp. P8-3-8]